MKTNYFFFAALFAAFLGVAPLAAQVTIGGGDAPKAGTILDLNSASGNKGGLVLSNVELTSLNDIPITFPNAGSLTPEDKGKLAGMIVWNSNDYLQPLNDGDPAGDGLYLWDGNGWNYIGGSDGQYTLSPLSAVGIVPETENGGLYVGGVTFRITRPADWTDAYWAALSADNITAYRNNAQITTDPASFKADGADYIYTIYSSTTANEPNTYIEVSGDVNQKSMETKTSEKITLTPPLAALIELSGSSIKAGAVEVVFKIQNVLLGANKWSEEDFMALSDDNVTATIDGNSVTTGSFTKKNNTKGHEYTIPITLPTKAGASIKVTITISGTVNGKHMKPVTFSKSYTVLGDLGDR
jgi:hypothetical protein